MKTDDDAFVRVDEILNSLRRTNVTHGLLYGLINSDSRPHRNPESKWYISPEVSIQLILLFRETTVGGSTSCLFLLNIIYSKQKKALKIRLPQKMHYSLLALLSK